MRQRWLAALGPLLGLALFAFALWVLHGELRYVQLQAILLQSRSITGDELAVALLLMVAGCFSLAGYDVLALRWIRHPIRWSRIARASLVATVFGRNAGLASSHGSAVRYRMFSSWGLTPSELARVISFNQLSFWLGFLFLGGLALSLDPIRIPLSYSRVLQSTRGIGLLLLALLALYLLAIVSRRRRLNVRGFEIELPGAGTTLAQIAVSTLDWLIAAAVLYALLPTLPVVSLLRFAGVFVLAQVAGMLSRVPAGLGVFDTVVALLLAPWLEAEVVIGVLIVYRVVYQLVPLTVALAAFAVVAIVERRQQLRATGALLARWMPELVPRAFAIAAFAAGAALLLSSAIPGQDVRIELVSRWLPLPLLEASHLLAGVMGVTLLLLSRALQQRVDAGYELTLALLIGGSLALLLRGLDWEIALPLALLAAALAPCRRYFYRRSSLVGQFFAPGWLVAIAVTLISVGFVGVLAYHYLDYAHSLFWQVAVDAHASRSLRTLASGGLVLALFALARLLRPAPPAAPATAAADVERAAPIVTEASRARAHLALVGDKRLLFHESGGGFLMYGVRRRSWIALGDPIGSPDASRELAWRFRELADRHAASASFYEVGAENLPVYLDLGLQLRKLGEEARVPLAEFTLAGGARKGLRQTQARMQREGCHFEVIGREDVAACMDELRVVSEQWLSSKRTREKRFSVGTFDPDYLRRCPLALVRHAGRIVAFANLWAPSSREELSIDLMRHLSDAPSGVMEYLFTELMVWGNAQGFRWFSLGMAPLSGFEHHRLAPRWNRLGALLFRHGEHFYNFQGLRAFKEKFDPVWEPRYLAAPGGLATPIVLTDVAALISGGVTGVIAR